MLEKRWIYKSLWGTGLVIKTTTRECIYDGMGNAIDTVQKPRIKVNFPEETCLLVVDDAMGTRFGMASEDIAKLIESKPGFGRWYHCIESPEKVLTKEETEGIEKVLLKKNAGRKSKVIHGPRGRG